MALFRCPNCNTEVFAHASHNCSACGNQNIGHKLVLVQGTDANNVDKPKKKGLPKKLRGEDVRE